MSEQNSNRAAMDPMDLWRQWFDAGSKMWSNVSGGGRENYMDPYGLYRQWFEGLNNAWGSLAGSTGGGSSMTSPFAAMMNNPFMAALNPATARPGSSTSQNTPGGPVEAQQTAVTMGAAEAQNLWKQWFEAVNDSWQQAAKIGSATADLAPRYAEMFEQIRHNFLSAQGYPTDPLQFATRWYNATSGPLSEFLGEVTEREEFLEPSSQLLKSYASFYRVFRRDSEEYLKALQIPVRSDISRVAGLVVALEEKIDRIEDALEDFEYGYSEPATAESIQDVAERIESLEQNLQSVGNGAATTESVQDVAERIESLEQNVQRAIEGSAESAATADSVSGLEERIDGVEAKIDRLLAALENAPQNGGAQVAEASEESGSQSDSQDDSEADEEIRATAAARRRAEEDGVDLSSVEGTGMNGQITVDDVRREGQS